MNKKISQIASTNLSNYDALIVIGSEAINDNNKLKQFAENGGGLFLMPGENTKLEYLKMLQAVYPLLLPRH